MSIDGFQGSEIVKCPVGILKSGMSGKTAAAASMGLGPPKNRPRNSRDYTTINQEAFFLANLYPSLKRLR